MRDLFLTQRGLSQEKQTGHLENPIKQLTGWTASQTHGKVPREDRRVQQIYWAVCPPASIQERENDGLLEKGLPLSNSVAQLLPLRSLRSQIIHLRGTDT